MKEANPDVAQAMEKINLVGDDATFYCGRRQIFSSVAGWMFTPVREGTL